MFDSPLYSLSPASLPVEASKYKLAWKLMIEDMELVKSPPANKSNNHEKDLTKLEEDLSLLRRMNTLTEELSCPHQVCQGGFFSVINLKY